MFKKKSLLGDFQINVHLFGKQVATEIPPTIENIPFMVEIELD